MSEAQKMEIAENLHRNDLEGPEKVKHVALWIKLTEEKNRQESVSRTAVLSDGRAAGPQHQASGVNEAVRVLDIGRTAAHESVSPYDKLGEDHIDRIVRPTLGAALPS